MVDVRIPTRLSDRQRELLEALATEAGERQGEVAQPQPARRKRGLGDRLKDAIS
jgi:DnaJ-class molecular chaperone